MYTLPHETLLDSALLLPALADGVVAKHSAFHIFKAHLLISLSRFLHHFLLIFITFPKLFPYPKPYCRAQFAPSVFLGIFPSIISLIIRL